MPLDGHLYLVSQGWRGKGTGLRDGAITRPLAIPQKKNLAGLGKDRDESFPFWDHLFTAAAKSIQLKCSSDSDGEGDIENSSCGAIRRTTTGILSNRRPVEGTPATPNTSTPTTDSSRPRLNLLATAKRDAAKQSLYSRFFRGPVLGPEGGSLSRNTIQIIDASLRVAIEKSGMGVGSKEIIGVVQEAKTSKRKRDLEGRGDEKTWKRRVNTSEEPGVEGLKVEESKRDKRKKKDNAADSHSITEDPAEVIDDGLERRRRKEGKIRLKLQKKKEKEGRNGPCSMLRGSN